MSYRLSYDAHRAIQRLYQSHMNYKEIREHIKKRLTLFVKEEKEKRLTEGELCKNTTRGFYDYVIERYPEYDFEKGYLDDDVMQNAIRNADKLFPELDISPDSERPFLKEFGRQYPEALQEIIRFNDNPEDCNFSPSLDNIIKPNTYISITLEEGVQKYMEEHRLAKSWKYATEIEKERSHKILIEMLGAKYDMSTFTQERANEIKSLTMNLPLRRKTMPKTRNLSIRDACIVLLNNYKTI